MNKFSFLYIQKQVLFFISMYLKKKAIQTQKWAAVGSITWPKHSDSYNTTIIFYLLEQTVALMTQNGTI